MSPPYSSPFVHRFARPLQQSPLARTRTPSTPTVSMRARPSPSATGRLRRVTMGASGCAVASMPSLRLLDPHRLGVLDSACSRSACAPAILRNRLPLEPRYRRRSSIVSTNPLMAVIGVRNSCDTFATKSWRSRSNRRSRVASDAQISTSRPSSSTGTRLTRMWITASGARSARSRAPCSAVPQDRPRSPHDGAGSAPRQGGRRARTQPQELTGRRVGDADDAARVDAHHRVGKWVRNARPTASRVSAPLCGLPCALTVAARARARPRQHTGRRPQQRDRQLRPIPRSSAGSSAAVRPCRRHRRRRHHGTGRPRSPDPRALRAASTRACGSRRHALSPGATPRRQASGAGRR